MRVLGLVCSARPGGNTEVMIGEALRAAAEMGAETELYLAGQKNIGPCTGCATCWSGKGCRIDDDMQELYVKLRESDGIIFGSPVHCWNVSAQAKAVIDRTHRFRQDRGLEGKVGGALVVAAQRGETTALSGILAFFTVRRMVIAATASAHAIERGAVAADPVAMEEARRVGRSVAALAALRGQFHL